MASSWILRNLGFSISSMHLSLIEPPQLVLYSSLLVSRQAEVLDIRNVDFCSIKRIAEFAIVHDLETCNISSHNNCTAWLFASLSMLLVCFSKSVTVFPVVSAV